MRTNKRPKSKSLPEFLKEVSPPISGEELFDHLPDIVFFIKDTEGAYISVNKTLVARFKANSKEDLLGKTAADLRGDELGRSFLEQDRKVLKTGSPLLGQLELHIHANGSVGWCLTTKLPLKNQSGAIIGLMGVSQDLRLPDFETEDYRQVANALAFAEANLSSPPSVEKLAALANMSKFQLDRRLRKIYGLTTGQWLTKIRIDTAQRLLSENKLSIAEIALQVGYSDQSSFTRQFRLATGCAPGEYRKFRPSFLP